MEKNTLQSKPHYAVLDGLRGVAAIMVVAFHIFEAHATSHADQIINHGYLAVDFFFVLSGFVVGYAYDDRWGRMSIGSFFKRRLIRLQPMVVMGMVVGAVCFYFQQSDLFPGISQVPVWKMLLIFIIGCTLIPVPPSMDIRGWAEMHPLNGPGWSLFFEYIANILYGLFVRKLSNTVLAIIVFVAAGFLFRLAVDQGDVIGGWSLHPSQLHIGFTRVMYPFFAGLLVFRVSKIKAVQNGFLWCSLLVVAVLAMPRMGSGQQLWMNGAYDALSIIVLFPLIVWLGAGSTLHSAAATRLCKFFGAISYPLYITHCPLIYIYTGWVATHKVPLQQAWPWGLAVFAGSITLAYACLKLYDEPVRKWLGKRMMNKEI